MELPKIQPNLMSILTEFRDVYGFDPMQRSWEEHLRGDAMDPDQVDDMMTCESNHVGCNGKLTEDEKEHGVCDNCGYIDFK